MQNQAPFLFFCPSPAAAKTPSQDVAWENLHNSRGNVEIDGHE